MTCCHVGTAKRGAQQVAALKFIQASTSLENETGMDVQIIIGEKCHRGVDLLAEVKRTQVMRKVAQQTNLMKMVKSQWCSMRRVLNVLMI